MKTYSAIKVNILPSSYEGKELVEVNLKAGATQQLVADRMRQYYHQYYEGGVGITVHKFVHNIDTGEREGERWTSPDRSSVLDACDVFYTEDTSHSLSAWDEQKLINTNRKIAREFTNSSVKVILHHGIPTDGRSNPSPSTKGINEEYYKKTKAQMRKLLKKAISQRKAKDLEYCKAKKIIAEQKEKLNQLSDYFAQEEKILVEVEI